MVLTSGTRLGPYEIQSPLGAGGMGEVYRAKDTRLERIVAIKILPAHLSSDPEAKQRLEREARAILHSNHPNICTLYDVGQQGQDRLSGDGVSGRSNAGGPVDERSFALFQPTGVEKSKRSVSNIQPVVFLLPWFAARGDRLGTDLSHKGI
jgi:serine/threonine protein kinase